MKIPFEQFDPNSEDFDPNQELIIAEKVTLKIVAGVVNLILKKASKAKTYGDLAKLDNLLNKYEAKLNPANNVDHERFDSTEDVIEQLKLESKIFENDLISL